MATTAVAEDAAEQAEKKRKQDEQRAHARSSAVKCAACNGLGHRSDSRLCPKRVAKAVRRCKV